MQVYSHYMHVITKETSGIQFLMIIIITEF